jgi:hypothetical protein
MANWSGWIAKRAIEIHPGALNVLYRHGLLARAA